VPPPLLLLEPELDEAEDVADEEAEDELGAAPDEPLSDELLELPLLLLADPALDDVEEDLLSVR
jgi:hypothetical protein